MTLEEAEKSLKDLEELGIGVLIHDNDGREIMLNDWVGFEWNSNEFALD